NAIINGVVVRFGDLYKTNFSSLGSCSIHKCISATNQSRPILPLTLQPFIWSVYFHLDCEPQFLFR
ncbi:Unknown protein, partial [Striga hermonthica]